METQILLGIFSENRKVLLTSGYFPTETVLDDSLDLAIIASNLANKYINCHPNWMPITQYKSFIQNGKLIIPYCGYVAESSLTPGSQAYWCRIYLLDEAMKDIINKAIRI